MNPILPSEVPYIIGFLVIVVALFWLVGRAGRSGLWSGRSGPVFSFGAAFFFAVSAILHAVGRDWWRAALFASGALFYLFVGWRHRQEA